MNNKKGYIQISILVPIVFGLLILGSSYFGVTQYSEIRKEKIAAQEQQKIADEKAELEKEKELQELIESQQRAIEDAQLEIEKLKMQDIVSKDKQNSLEQRILEDNDNTEVGDIVISASEIDQYLSGSVMVTCNYPDERSQGSGTLWRLPDSSDLHILTNKHVVGDTVGLQNCVASIKDSTDADRGTYYLDISNIRNWNDFTDVALLKVGKITEYDEEPSSYYAVGDKKTCTTNRYLADDGWCYYKEDLNYKISNLSFCPTKMPSGSSVVAIGFPAFGEKSVNIGGINGLRSFRIISNGIISGFDDTTIFNGLPFVNYFVSAKIDSGNSGGIALSKTESGLCVLGIPTWLNLGDYDTQGLVQNIHNVMYQP